MRSKLLLTTAALSMVLGAGGLAVAQDRGSQTIQGSEQTQNRPLNDNRRSTTGQAPSSTTQQPAQTAPDQAQTAPRSGGQPTQNNATGSQTGTQPGVTQPSTSQQPSSAQTNQPAPTNQPSSAQTNQPAPTNQPSSAQTAPSNQPSTATGSQPQQPAAAQQQPSQGTVTNQQAGQTQSQVRVSASLAPAQKTRLTQEFSRVNVRPVTNVNFSVSIGAVVPGTVVLHPVPRTIVEIVPQYRDYQFFVLRDEIVIVEPRSHKVVDVIEHGGGSSRAQATTSERKLNLSSQQKEIIRKHYSSKRVTTGAAPRARTKVIVGEEAPESVEIHTFPAEVYREVPAIRSYRYIEGDSGIYLVEPNSRRVIEEFD